MRVAVLMAQILVEGGKPGRNIARAVAAIAEAGRRECDFVLLPECLDLGWTDPSARLLAQPVPGRYFDELAEVAGVAGVHVVAGLVEREREALYNSAVLIRPDGMLLHKHRKINELDFARDLYATGESFAIAATELGPVGVDICADNFPDSLRIGQGLAAQGARILLSPCSWAVEADHDNVTNPYGGLWMESYTALATAYHMPVVGVSNVGWIADGPWRGRKCIGCSLAVAADGSVLARGPYGHDAEALIPVELEVSF